MNQKKKISVPFIEKFYFKGLKNLQCFSNHTTFLHYPLKPDKANRG